MLCQWFHLVHEKMAMHECLRVAVAPVISCHLFVDFKGLPHPQSTLSSRTSKKKNSVHKWESSNCRSCAFVPTCCRVWCWGSADTGKEVRANNHEMLLSDFLQSGSLVELCNIDIYFSTHNAVDEPTVLQCVSVECEFIAMLFDLVNPWEPIATRLKQSLQMS